MCRWDQEPRGQGATRVGPAFLFNLDGILIDSVYQHVLASNEL